MNKTIIFKQKGGFFNKLRLINNVNYWTNFKLSNIENLKIFDKYKQKYIFINTGGISGRGIYTQIKFNENYSKIKLEDYDFKIIKI